MSHKVSVLMAVYKGGRYLRESVESILAQKFTDFEFIIVDDGSCRETADILEEYAGKDSRIVLVRNEKNLGLTRSLNTGLQRASGKYIARQDADDISTPDRLERQARFLDRNPDVVLTTCDMEVIGPDGELIERYYHAGGPEVTRWFLLFDNRVGPHGAVMFRKDAVGSIGAYKEDLTYAQDYELWSRLARTGKIVIIPAILYRWRRHQDAVSVSFGPEQRQVLLRQARANISQMGCDEIGADEVMQLSDFWNLDRSEWQDPVPAQGLLITICGAFARAGMYGANPGKALRKIRIAVGKHFLYWAIIFVFDGRFRSAYKAALFSLYWDPLSAAYLLAETCRILLDSPYCLYKKFRRNIFKFDPKIRSSPGI